MLKDNQGPSKDSEGKEPTEATVKSVEELQAENAKILRRVNYYRRKAGLRGAFVVLLLAILALAVFASWKDGRAHEATSKTQWGNISDLQDANSALEAMTERLEDALVERDAIIEEWNVVWDRRESRLEAQRFEVKITVGDVDLELVESWLEAHGFSEPQIERWSETTEYTVVLNGLQQECFNALKRGRLLDTRVSY